MEFEHRLRPGDLIKTSKGLFWHFSIVSNRRCTRGKLMLISARKETGTVCEEPYDGVVGGRMTVHARHQSALPPYKILRRARSQIGEWRYDCVTQNCENFANWAYGLEARSTQAEGVVTGIALFLTAVIAGGVLTWQRS